MTPPATRHTVTHPPLLRLRHLPVYPPPVLPRLDCSRRIRTPAAARGAVERVEHLHSPPSTVHQQPQHRCPGGSSSPRHLTHHRAATPRNPATSLLSHLTLTLARQRPSPSPSLTIRVLTPVQPFSLPPRRSRRKRRRNRSRSCPPSPVAGPTHAASPHSATPLAHEAMEVKEADPSNEALKVIATATLSTTRGQHPRSSDRLHLLPISLHHHYQQPPCPQPLRRHHRHHHHHHHHQLHQLPALQPSPPLPWWTPTPRPTRSLRLSMTPEGTSPPMTFNAHPPLSPARVRRRQRSSPLLHPAWTRRWMTSSPKGPPSLPRSLPSPLPASGHAPGAPRLRRPMASSSDLLPVQQLCVRIFSSCTRPLRASAPAVCSLCTRARRRACRSCHLSSTRSACSVSVLMCCLSVRP